MLAMMIKIFDKVKLKNLKEFGVSVISGCVDSLAGFIISENFFKNFDK